MKKLLLLEELATCSGWARVVTTCIIAALLFVGLQYLIDVAMVDSKPPITVHSTFTETPVAIDRSFNMMVDRTKHRHCESEWKVVMVNENTEYSVAEKPGSFFRDEVRKVIEFWYHIPHYIPRGLYTIKSRGIYRCEDGGVHVVDQYPFKVEVR